MRQQEKAVIVDEIAAQLSAADAVFAVDYRGISVSQIAELRAQLREAETRFRIVKNTLTRRAVDKAGAEQLKEHLTGPTAFAFVEGDAALAAKALNRFASADELITFKGGIMDGAPLTAEEIQRLARLPGRDQLHGQLVWMVAAPLAGVARGLNGLLGGLAIALAQVQEQRPATVDAGPEPEPEPEAEPAAEVQEAPPEEGAEQPDQEAPPDEGAEQEEASEDEDDADEQQEE